MDRTDEFHTVDGTEIHYSGWGSATADPVLCLHGLSRVGRDFDPLARELADSYRVLCPDMPGRGLSEWADDPEEYASAAMTDLLVGFCEDLEPDPLRVVGTSMGGGLGLALAGGPLAGRVTRLAMNDVGPAPTESEDAADGTERILEYLTNPPAFDALTELEAYYRETYEPFSPMPDDEWRRFAVTSARRNEVGEFLPAYDTAVVRPLFEEAPDPEAEWALWEAVDADLFVLRGERSDVLAESTFDEMLERRPDAESLVVEDCGHAPALNVDEQVEPIRAFLAE